MAKPKPAEPAPEPEIPLTESEIPPPAEPETFAGPAATELAGPAPRPPGRILPLVAGGAIAAALGFGSALYLTTAYPQALGIAGSAGADQRLSDIGKRLDDLSAAIAQAPGSPTDLSALAALKADVAASRTEGEATAAELGALRSALDKRFGDIERRLDAIETAPQVPGGASAAEIAAQTEAARKAAAEAERLRAEAEALTKKAEARAALGELHAAFESGAPIEPALARLTGVGANVPEALASQGQGVPTLAALRDGFPAAARDALTISLGETGGSSGWSRLTAFLRSQTGARSLTPRAGDDPDAVLSRAEAALGAGDVQAALAEIAALPEGGRARMAEWAGLAERRLAAAGAIAALTAELQ